MWKQTSKMASLSAGPAAFFLASFLLVLQTCSASATPAPSRSTTANNTTIKVSDLPPMTSGVSGLSRFSNPIEQQMTVYFYYPRSHWNLNHRDHVTYRCCVHTYFQCVQPTRRIVINANPEWEFVYLKVFSVESGKTFELAVKQVLFNSADKTLYVDLVDNMVVGVTYDLSIDSAQHIVDQDDRFGIQAFHRTSQVTGESIITIDLPVSPGSMWRFVPGFDDPFYKIVYNVQVRVHNSDYSFPIALVNGQPAGGYSNCPADDLTKRYVSYLFYLPKMALEALQLRVVPWSWNEVNSCPANLPCL